MIDTIQYSTVICDNCGRRFVWLDAPSPQQVTQHLVDQYGWTAFDEVHHCDTCPPICASCGREDIDCGCIPPMGDAVCVSREPMVIVPIDCVYQSICSAMGCVGACRGQG